MDARGNIPEIDLSWLVKPPDTFRERIRELRKLESDPRALGRELAGYRLRGSQLHTLDTTLAELASNEANAIRVGVLSNGTIDLVLPALTVAAPRHGVWIQTISAAFDQVAAESLDPNSTINKAHSHFALVLIDYRELPLVPTPGDEERARESVRAAVNYVDSIRAALSKTSGCTVVVQTAPAPPESLFGSLDTSTPGTLSWLIDHYNRELTAKISGSYDLLLDTGRLAQVVGLPRWHDPTQWTLGNFSYALHLIPLYADWVGRLIGSAHGKSRKCLVLDLDNTLLGRCHRRRRARGHHFRKWKSSGRGIPGGSARRASLERARCRSDRIV